MPLGNPRRLGRERAQTAPSVNIPYLQNRLNAFPGVLRNIEGSVSAHRCIRHFSILTAYCGILSVTIVGNDFFTPKEQLGSGPPGDSSPERQRLDYYSLESLLRRQGSQPPFKNLQSFGGPSQYPTVIYPPVSFQAYPQLQVPLPTDFVPSKWSLPSQLSTHSPAHPPSQSGPMASETPTPAKPRFRPDAKRIYCEECISAIAYGKPSDDDCEKCDPGQTEEEIAEERRVKNRLAQRKYKDSMKGQLRTIERQKKKTGSGGSKTDASEAMP